MLIPLEHGGPSSAPLMWLSKNDGGMNGSVSGQSLFTSMAGRMAHALPWPPVNSRPSPDKIQRLPPLPDVPPRRAESDEATIYDFHYHLALEDHRTCRLVSREIGLWDAARGFVLSSWDANQQPVTLLCGDASLYREYTHLFDRWSQILGRPKACHFTSEFHRSDRETAHAELGRAGDDWIISRKFCKQIVRLP